MTEVFELVPERCASVGVSAANPCSSLSLLGLLSTSDLEGIWNPSRNCNFSSLLGLWVAEIRNYFQIPCSGC